MSDLPLVSIVTPVYNQAEYLEETIKSVLAQDYPNIEYIILDDGSTDDTPEILKKYSHKVRCERHDNMGQVLTLNKGWEMSGGDIVGYLSSDDILYPDAVSKLVTKLIGDEDVACVFPDSDLIDEKSRIAKRNVCKPFDLEETVVKQECYIGPGALFRKAFFEAIGGWKSNLKLAPDREFWIQLSSYGRIEMYDEVLAGYRLHGGSISYKDVAEEVSREYLWVLDDYYNQKGIPQVILERKAEAYGCAYLLISRNCFRAGNIARGMELYAKACSFYPQLGGWGYKFNMARNVVSKPLRLLHGLLFGWLTH